MRCRGHLPSRPAVRQLLPIYRCGVRDPQGQALSGSPHRHRPSAGNMAQDWRVYAVVYFYSVGSDLPWAVLNWRLDMESVDMTEEDEEFQRLEREAKMRALEDDDIQDYKKPWAGLRAEEIEKIQDAVFGIKPHYVALARAVEAKLKEKNT